MVYSLDRGKGGGDVNFRTLSGPYDKLYDRRNQLMQALENKGKDIEEVQ